MPLILKLQLNIAATCVHTTRNLKKSEYRSKLNKARRKAGIYGKGGPDMSHDRKGRLARESMKINRARNGHGNNKRYRA